MVCDTQFRFLMVRYGHRAAIYGPPLQLIMTFYPVPTTNDDIDYTCAELIRRAAYVNTTDLAQTMAHDAINMIRSLQAELQRAQAAYASTAVVWTCEICGRTHSRTMAPSAVVPRYCQPNKPGGPPTSCQVAAKMKQDKTTNAERQRRHRAQQKASADQ